MCFHREDQAAKWRREQPEKLVAMVKLMRKGRLFAAWPTPDATNVKETGMVIRALKHWHPEADLVVDLTEVNALAKKLGRNVYSVSKYLEFSTPKWLGTEEHKFLKGLLAIEGDPFEYIMQEADNKVWRKAAWHLHEVEKEKLGSHVKVLEHDHAHV